MKGQLSLRSCTPHMTKHLGILVSNPPEAHTLQSHPLEMTIYLSWPGVVWASPWPGPAARVFRSFISQALTENRENTLRTPTVYNRLKNKKKLYIYIHILFSVFLSCGCSKCLWYLLYLIRRNVLKVNNTNTALHQSLLLWTHREMIGWLHHSEEGLVRPMNNKAGGETDLKPEGNQQYCKYFNGKKQTRKKSKETK